MKRNKLVRTFNGRLCAILYRGVEYCHVAPLQKIEKSIYSKRINSYHIPTEDCTFLLNTKLVRKVYRV